MREIAVWIQLNTAGFLGRQQQIVAILHIDDAIGVRAGVEKAQGQGLAVQGEMVEVEVILELAAHVPKPVLRVVWLLALPV